MKLIVGLGNPGKKYEHTRHNAGFLAISQFQKQHEEFKEWKFNKKFNAEISPATINNEKVMLAKPQTFMNSSGMAVKAMVQFYKLEPKDVWVIHDDLDLPLGTLRIKTGGSSAGHNGVQSIIDVLGTDFARFRIGIAEEEKNEEAEQFVLKPFALLDTVQLKHTIKITAEAMMVALADDLKVAIKQFST